MLPRFEALGLSEIAARLRAIAGGASADEGEADHASDYLPVPAELAEADVLSLAAAAALLGFRSPTTVLGLAEVGSLEGFWRRSDGTVVVTSRSAEAYLGSPGLAGQRLIESQIWSALGDQA